MPDRAPTLRLLETGQLTVRGRIVTASNATFLGTVRDGEATATCVYKPVRGERSLEDFPDGTLWKRERAAYLVSDAGGWDIVPPTVTRADGPFGAGMAQLWIDVDEGGFLLRELASGITVEDVKQATAAPLRVASDVKEMQFE